MPRLNRFEKELDKSKLLLYTMKRKVQRMRGFTFADMMRDQTVAGRICNLLETTNEVCQGVAQEYGVDVTIAGGAVRDSVFGYYPNDIDIFVGLGGFDEDEKDDILLLYGDAVMKKLAKAFELMADDGDVTKLFAQTGEAYKARGITDMFLYGSQWVQVWPGDPNDDFFGGQGTKFQFIGRDTAHPEELMRQFDYELTKCYIEPKPQLQGDLKTFQRVFKPEFMEAVAKKTVTATSPQTHSRIQEWDSRWGELHNHGWTVNVAYEQPMKTTRAKKYGAVNFFEQQAVANNMDQRILNNALADLVDWDRPRAVGIIEDNF